MFFRQKVFIAVAELHYSKWYLSMTTLLVLYRAGI